jgi:hypothetical protein
MSEILKYEVKDELVSLTKTNGGQLTPAAVVNAARSRDSPLHQFFDWSDTSAAEKFRLLQARQLIRAVVTMLPSKNKQQQMVRAFVSLPDDRSRREGYRLTTEVIKDKDLRRKMLGGALREAQSFANRYRHLRECAKVVEAIDEFEEEVSDVIDV